MEYYNKTLNFLLQNFSLLLCWGDWHLKFLFDLMRFSSPVLSHIGFSSLLISTFTSWLCSSFHQTFCVSRSSLSDLLKFFLLRCLNIFRIAILKFLFCASKLHFWVYFNRFGGFCRRHIILTVHIFVFLLESRQPELWPLKCFFLQGTIPPIGYFLTCLFISRSSERKRTSCECAQVWSCM